MRRNETNDGATVQSLKLALARAEERIACQREQLRNMTRKIELLTRETEHLSEKLIRQDLIHRKLNGERRATYEAILENALGRPGVAEVEALAAKQTKTVSPDVTHIEKLAEQAREDFRCGKTEPWPPNPIAFAIGRAIAYLVVFGFASIAVYYGAAAFIDLARGLK